MRQKRILISRPDRIGDVVLSTPIPREIKRKFPDSYVAVLLRSYTKDIYLNNPFVDDIIIYDTEKDSFRDKLSEIRKHKFTHGLMLLPNEKVNYLMFLAGIKHRVGVGHKFFQFLTFTKYVNRNKYIPLRHEADYCMDLARKIGVGTSNISTEIYLTDLEKRRVQEVKDLTDITEWYPENVAFKFRGIRRLSNYIKLFLFNIYTVNLADGLIIGEVTKKRRYDIIAPFKPKSIIGYYPVLEYFPYKQPAMSTNEFTMGYAGIITFERGIMTLLRAAEELAAKQPDKVIKLKIAGRFQYKEEERIFKIKAAEQSLVKVEFCEWVEYPQIASVINGMDVCFDLREKTFIYRNSLPIKIFEYMSCGKPVIYSDIKPIRKEMRLEDFGFLINPGNSSEIVEVTEKYLNDPKLIQKHSYEARKAVEEKFNWERLESRLFSFIGRFL